MLLYWPLVILYMPPPLLSLFWHSGHCQVLWILFLKDLARLSILFSMLIAILWLKDRNDYLSVILNLTYRRLTHFPNLWKKNHLSLWMCCVTMGISYIRHIESCFGIYIFFAVLTSFAQACLMTCCDGLDICVSPKIHVLIPSHWGLGI